MKQHTYSKMCGLACHEAVRVRVDSTFFCLMHNESSHFDDTICICTPGGGNHFSGASAESQLSDVKSVISDGRCAISIGTW